MQPIRHELYQLKKTLACKFLGKADVQRWADLRNYKEKWDERTEMIASLIPENSRIIEFGAGRRRLEAYLDPSCTYFPSDLVSRGPGTIICNLNERPLPDLRDLKLDVAVFGGVLEYIADLRAIPAWLVTFVSTCIASYNCVDSSPKTVQRTKDALTRARVGWINTFDEDELAAIFEAGGLFCSHRLTRKTKSGDERIFIFEKKHEQVTR